MKMKQLTITLTALVATLWLASFANAFTWVNGTYNASTSTLSWSSPADVVTLSCPTNVYSECFVGNVTPPSGQGPVFKIFAATYCLPNDHNCVQPLMGLAPVTGGDVDILDNVYLQPHALIELNNEVSTIWAVVYSSEVQE